MWVRLLRLVSTAICGLVAGSVLADESAGAQENGVASQPELSLSIRESGPEVPWRMQVQNDGDEPVVLSADPQLLWMEVKVPGKKRVESCRLPKELFPTRPNPRANLLLRPGESAARSFDPRLYCYSERGQYQLVPGAQITPHFGWPQRTRTTWKHGKRIETVVDEPPYVARVDEHAAEQPPPTPDTTEGHLKEIEGPTFALGSNYAMWSRTRLPDADETEGPFELKLASGSDAHAERNATISLSLQNRSKRSRYVYFRREFLTFEVMGPDGLTQCDPEPDFRAPERYSFSYLPAGKSLTVASRLVELCPRGTFGRPGLYLVHARFDARWDGEEFDLDAFVGSVSTRNAVGIRIRTGDKVPLRLHRVQASHSRRTLNRRWSGQGVVVVAAAPPGASRPRYHQAMVADASTQAMTAIATRWRLIQRRASCHPRERRASVSPSVRKTVAETASCCASE